MKNNNLDGMHYAQNIKKTTRSKSVNRTNRNKLTTLYDRVPRLAVKVSGLAVVRILARLRNVENILRQPFLHDNHGLEPWVRMIIRDEIKAKRGKK